MKKIEKDGNIFFYLKKYKFIVCRKRTYLKNLYFYGNYGNLSLPSNLRHLGNKLRLLINNFKTNDSRINNSGINDFRIDDFEINNF